MPKENQIRHHAASNEKLETARLLLEPLLASHAAKLFPHLQDEALRFIGRPESLSALEERYRKWEARGPANGGEVWLNWAAKVKQTDFYIGWFQATLMDTGMTHLSYVVFPPYWRRGFSTEACDAMIAHLRCVYDSRAFVVEMAQANLPSIAMAEKLGFTRCAQAAPGEFRYELASGDMGM